MPDETGQLTRLCESFRRRIAALLLRQDAAQLAAAALALLAGAVGLDWLARFGPAGRWATLGAYAAALAGLVIWTVRRRPRQRWSDLDVLTYLDSLDESGGDRLVSLYQMRQRPEDFGESATAEGRALLEHAREKLAQSVKAVVPAAAFRTRALRRWEAVAAVLLLAGAGLAAAFPTQAGVALARVFLPFSPARWPTRTLLEVQAPRQGHPQGADLTITTLVHGQRPEEVELVYRSAGADYWLTQHVPVGADGQARYTFEAVSEAMTFYVRGGDDRTDRYRVEIIERPRLKRVTAYYTYPPYARLANRRIDSAQVRGLEGTQVRLEFESTVPIVSAVYAQEGQDDQPLDLTSPTTFEVSLTLRTDGRYAIKMTDAAGFREYRPEKYDIQVLPDAPPTVQLLAPGRDIVATKNASLRFALAARDDFGLQQVQVVCAVTGAGAPEPLSDKITGPIPQGGTDSRAEFTWDFAQLETRAASVDVEYWAVARDCNPTGRGVAESPRYKVSLLTPTDFQLQILYEARKVLAEARIAYRNEKKAYLLAGQWLARGGSAADDEEVFRQLVEKHEAACRASAAIERWGRELREHIDRNRMGEAFMENRLAAIEDLRRGSAEQLAEVTAGLEAAVPRSSAAAQPDRLKATRAAALAAVGERQKMAVVGLGRMLRKLYDWENLQTSLVNTRLLRERQSEIFEMTRELAPQTIGREAEDLDERTLDQVLALAQQQRAAMEAQTSLENQLAAVALKADAEGRASVKRYLLTAYGYLRDAQVNQNLKIIAQRIGDNQLSDVAKEQADVITALRVVEGGLVAAGKDVQTDEVVGVAALLAPDQEDVESVAVAASQPAGGGEEGAIAQVDEAAVQKLLEEVAPAGEDPLSQSLMALAEEQDSIRSRSDYLAGTLKPDDMPRYRRLKMGMLRYRQDQAAELARGRLGPVVAKSDYAPLISPWFDVLSAQLTDVRKMLDADRLGPDSSAFQRDIVEGCRDLAQFIARQKRVMDMVDEHLRKGHKDDFDRPYLLAGADLDKAMALYRQLDWNHTLQGSLARKSRWLAMVSEAPATLAALEELGKRLAGETAERQKLLAGALAEAKAAGGAFSEDVRGKVEQTGLTQLPDVALTGVAARIRALQLDQEILTQQEQAIEQMRQTLYQIRELIDERQATVSPAGPEVAVGPTATGPATATGTQPAPETYLTEEDLAARTTPEAIRAALAATDRLSPAVRDELLRSLPQTFPDKYRRLMGAYYRTLLEGREEPSQGAAP